MAAVKKLVQECHWPEFKKQNFFAEQFTEKEEFSDKQLNDTKYAARFALAYLKLVCKDVVAVKGGVTAELRQMWGLQDGKKHENGHNPLVLSNVFLNDLELAKEEWKKSGSKSRLDHRHHTVDAIVIACTTRSAIQKISTYRRKFGNMPSVDRDENKKLIAERRKTPVFPQPWIGFTDDVKDRVRDVVISFAKKNPYQPQGALHEETFYGRLEAHDNLRNEEKLRVDKGEVYTTRKAIHSLKAPMIDKVADPKIRKMFYDRLAANGMLDENGVIIKLSDKDWEKRWKAILEQPFIHTNGLAIKKVRIRVPSSNIREIRPGMFAEPGKNHHYAFYKVAAPAKKGKGKKGASAVSDWEITGEIVTLFDAAKRKVNGKQVIDKANNDPERIFLFSLSENDMVLIARDESHYRQLRGFDFSDKSRYNELFDYVYRVQKMTEGAVTFRHHSMTQTKMATSNNAKDESVGRRILAPSSFKNTVIKLKVDELGYISIAKS
jgi:CRISPR-associated endonuclease Csn1